jgi:hypothetical protein
MRVIGLKKSRLRKKDQLQLEGRNICIVSTASLLGVFGRAGPPWGRKQKEMEITADYSLDGTVKVL